MNINTGEPQPLVAAIDAFYEQRQHRSPSDPFQRRLGASAIGDDCERRLYYQFRWGAIVEHEGRVLRLFETGQVEELRLLRQLKNVGVILQPTEDPTEQHTFTGAGGHLVAKVDGIALGGVPEAEHKPHIVELKTANRKRFNALEKKGVREAEPKHYAQVQLPMHLSGIDRALYLAKCKDDERLYVERVEYDKDYAERLISKAERIIASDYPPARVSDDAEKFPCSFCDYNKVCHGEQLPPPTCRSCTHSTPLTDGVDGDWHCAMHKRAISFDEQIYGARKCEQHRYAPPLLEHWAEPAYADNEQTVTYRHRRTNKMFGNGERGQNVYTSRELYRAADKGVLSDPFIEELREEFEAELR